MELSLNKKTHISPKYHQILEHKMNFAGMLMPSLIDYPGKVSAVLFTSGCNLTCPHCHNWEIANGLVKNIDLLDAFAQIIDRLDFIDGLVITGGEPTINEDLPNFLRNMKKELGIPIKLDTNGLRPDILAQCFPFLDYVAMDVKTSLERYAMLGCEMPDELGYSIEIIKHSGIDHEFRCTAVPILIDQNNVDEIGRLVEGANLFAIQQFNPENARDEYWKLLNPYTQSELEDLRTSLLEYVDNVIIRN